MATSTETDAGACPSRGGRSISAVAPVTPIVPPGVALVLVASTAELGCAVAVAAAGDPDGGRVDSRPQALPLVMAGTPAATAPAGSTVPTLSGT